MLPGALPHFPLLPAESSSAHTPATSVSPRALEFSSDHFPFLLTYSLPSGRFQSDEFKYSSELLPVQLSPENTRCIFGTNCLPRIPTWITNRLVKFNKMLALPSHSGSSAGIPMLVTGPSFQLLKPKLQTQPFETLGKSCCLYLQTIFTTCVATILPNQ